MRLLLVLFALAGLATVASAAAEDVALEAVRRVDLGNGRFTTVEAHPSAEVGGDWRPHPAAGLAEVAWVLRPEPVSFIRCIVFLPPAERWDGRLRAVGSGGPAGFVRKDELARLAQSCGSAVAYTDLGTSDRKMTRPGRIEDFGHRATHLMTVSAKKVVAAFYGRPAHHCYFEGESTGGNQAFQELLRYPDDYDGILAGVPAFARMATHVYFQWNWRQLHDDDGKPVFSTAELVAVTNAAERYFAETGRRGLARRYTEEAERAVLDRAAALVPSLGSADKRERLHRMFAGPVVNGRSVGKGVAFGAWLPHAGGNEWMLRWRIGQDRSLQSVTDGELEAWMAAWSPLCDATSTDMSAFAAHGGKLIAYAGEIDPCIPWEPLVNWHRAANCPDSRAVYLLPGRAHGGPPEIRDAYRLLVDWVEKGVRPETVTLVRPGEAECPLKPLPAADTKMT